MNIRTVLRDIYTFVKFIYPIKHLCKYQNYDLGSMYYDQNRVWTYLPYGHSLCLIGNWHSWLVIGIADGFPTHMILWYLSNHVSDIWGHGTVYYYQLIMNLCLVVWWIVWYDLLYWRGVAVQLISSVCLWYTPVGNKTSQVILSNNHMFNKKWLEVYT